MPGHKKEKYINEIITQIQKKTVSGGKRKG
jgi:hypothetical protein